MGKLHFNIDLPQLLRETYESNDGMGVFKVPISVAQNKLAQISQRAIELDDPQLNILMLETKLYEVEHSDIIELIKKQKQRLK